MSDNAPEIPNPVVKCDGCGKDLNMLAPFLAGTVKPQHMVLLAVDSEVEGDEIPTQEFSLGSRKGRGAAWKFHDFDCYAKKIAKFKGKGPQLQVHKEDEIYVPADNRSPEELVEAGELPKAMLAVIDSKPAEGGEQ